MNQTLIHELFSVPKSTLARWQKSRPTYAQWLDVAARYFRFLSDEQQQVLFESRTAKRINAELGIHGHFAEKECRLTSSTISNWLSSGKNRLYIGLIFGAAVMELQKIIEGAGTSLEAILKQDIALADLIFLSQHRPHLILTLIRLPDKH